MPKGITKGGKTQVLSSYRSSQSIGLHPDMGNDATENNEKERILIHKTLQSVSINKLNEKVSVIQPFLNE